MIKLTLKLPKATRLKLRSRNHKRRASSAPTLLDELKQLGNIRSGNKASRAGRVVLERFNIKTIFGRNIAFVALTASLLTPAGTSLAQAEVSQPVETPIIITADQKLTTEVVIRLPFDKPRLNQGFSFFHPGIDLGGSLGTPIYPIENGTVEVTEMGQFGYGNTIIVDHKNGLKSRYAHLSRIDVKVGQDVNTSTAIGLLGSTGHSTGPHLHLEVYKNGNTVDPRTVLGSIDK